MVASRGDKPERVNYDKGFVGKVLDVGVDRYKHDPKKELSSFIVLEGKNGQRHEVWGVGIAETFKDSGAKIGDTIELRREGVDRVLKNVRTVDPQTGKEVVEPREVHRNRWEITAAKLREAPASELARDKDLVGAQSQLKVIESIVQQIEDPQKRRQFMDLAREAMAQKIEQGKTFPTATVAEPVKEKAAEIAQKAQERPEPERTR
ncbi:hypothetical protein ACFW16_32570 [Inquilinus sp. NPDC058860]|uniref:hypothetical protein n=1 Tax=Inquilinus sp. NPDC058860 TaxID=3346652 RepID=UPI0036AFC4C3